MATSTSASRLLTHANWLALRSLVSNRHAVPSISLTDCDDPEAVARTTAYTTAALGSGSTFVPLRGEDPIGSIAVPLAGWLGEGLRPHEKWTSTVLEGSSGKFPLSVFFGNHAPRRSGFPEGAPFVTVLFKTALGFQLVVTTLNEGGINGLGELTFIKHLLEEGDVLRLDHPALSGTSFRSSRLAFLVRALLDGDPELIATEIPLNLIPDPTPSSVLWVDSIGGRRRNIKLNVLESEPTWAGFTPGAEIWVTINGKRYKASWSPQLGKGTTENPLILAPSSTSHDRDGIRFLDLFVVGGSAATLFAPERETSLVVGTPVRLQPVE